jgi:hypothetical protein
MSGEVANNSSDNRALHATARPRARWVNDYNGCKESHYWKPFFMKTSFRETINNSSMPWFQPKNKINDRLVAPRGSHNHRQGGQRETT